MQILAEVMLADSELNDGIVIFSCVGVVELL